MPLNARGVYGELRKGHQVVARFSDWALSEDGRIEGTPTDINTFRIEEGGPFSVRLQLGSRFWVWRDAEVMDTSTPFVVRANGSPDVQ